MRSPVIAIDATYGVKHPRHPLTGVGVYSQELLRGLAAARGEEQFRWCYRAHRFWLGLREPKPSNASARLLSDGIVPACDLFHGLNQRMPSKRVRRTVCTFHDLFVMTSEVYSSPEFRARFAQQAKEAAARSDLIITVSAFTAGQVESLLGVERGRIRVVHHGVRVPVSQGLERQPMILSVGALQTRKNTVRLVEAFEALDAPEWRLVLAGSQGFGAEPAMERIARSTKRGLIEVRGFVSDVERERLYQQASIFAFPSLDEGFGMPVLEAMANGTPVLTSNASSLPEVAGENGTAAVLVDPTDGNAIAAGLQRLVDDAEQRARLAVAGLERARGFTWEAAVGRTWAVYGELLGG